MGWIQAVSRQRAILLLLNSKIDIHLVCKVRFVNKYNTVKPDLSLQFTLVLFTN